MAENSAIEWTTHTFNPWRGCTKVSAGCANCYAEVDYSVKIRGVKWGPQGNRIVKAESGWSEPLKWDRLAKSAGERHRVFCASLADVFESWDGPMLDSKGNRLVIYKPNGGFLTTPAYIEEPPANCRWMTMQDVRNRLFRLIDATPNLDWLILSKRPENFARMMADHYSIGYNKANEAQAKRSLRIPSSSDGRAGDRLSGSNLAGGEADGGQVDGWCEDDAVQKSPRRDAKRIWLPASSGDERQEEVLRSSAQDGLDSFLRANTGRDDGEPQEGEQVRQPAERIGVGDILRAEDSRSGSAGSESPSSDRIEAPQDASRRSGCVGDSPATRNRRTGQGDRERLQDESKGGERHLPPHNVEAHLKLPNNLWLGVSVENQQAADERIPKLLKVPAAVRFLSCEPLLGPVDLEPYMQYPPFHENYKLTFGVKDWRGVDWVIVGGESGPKARPCNVAWIRSIVEQCKAAGTACFVKQIGKVWIIQHEAGNSRADALVKKYGVNLIEEHYFAHDKKGGDMEEWPSDLRVREFPSDRPRSNH